jgi:hypothetical protein
MTIIPPTRPARAASLFLFACTAIGLGGCQDILRSTGMIRGAPDEFAVTTRAPLAMPTGEYLPPPTPGVPRPQESPERLQAEEALVPQTALGVAAAPDTTGQQALVQAAGPPAPPHIRQEVNSEAALDVPHQTLTERMMFWEPKPVPGTVLDAQKEAQRLRENAALGQSVETGDTPIVQPKRKSVLGSINPF